MRIFTLALIALLGMGTPAFAADLPTLPGFAESSSKYEWSGFYVGGHGGYAWGDWKGPMFYEDAYKYADPEKYPNLTFDGSDKTISADSWFGGAQVGVNHQSGKLVLGLEADVSIGEFKNEGSFLPYPDNKPSPAWHITTEIDWLATARARVGYLVNSKLLAYVTGGLAIAQVQSDIEPVYTGRDPVSFAHAENNHVGWVAGAGFEYALSKSVSIKTEYQYVDLGNQDYDFHGTTNGVPSYDTDHFKPDLDLHTVKVGLNVRF